MIEFQQGTTMPDETQSAEPQRGKGIVHELFPLWALAGSQSWDMPAEPTPLAELRTAMAQVPKGESLPEWVERLNRERE